MNRTPAEVAATYAAPRTSDIFNFYKPLKVIERPSQELLLFTVGRTELAVNEVLLAVHHGEDGPGFDVVRTREFTIAAQTEYHWSEMQDWARDEAMDRVMLTLDGDADGEVA
jgi:hypothetical protein